MTESSHAVFLSYASEDAEAAQRIAESLRAAGIEVWFDKSELRGGDAWDRQIRDQIHHCRLFIPVISANSERRDEGYFRREWSLAADRTRDMAHKRAFLVPVVIDATPERGASVPEKFHELQWTRLPAGETSLAFVDRVRRLLSPELPIHGALTPASSGFATAETSRTFVRSWRSKSALWAIGAALAVALSYVIVDKLWLSERTAPTANSAAPSATAPEKSIAVLPFVDMSEKHDQEYFADGMAEEIIDLLAKIPGLTVIGRTSSFQFKGKNADLRTIGTQLNASYVLEGSVRRSGDEVRITAQLINTRTGTHEWSETYDRQIGDVLKLQDAIAAAVVRELQLTVATRDTLISRSILKNTDVYDLILRGRHAADRIDKEGLDEAVTLFQQALDRDPTSADAAAELAYAYVGQVLVGSLKPAVGYEQARHAATNALRLDPKNVLAHVVMAGVHIGYDWDWTGAEQELKQAATIAPGNGNVLQSEALLSWTLGRWDDALKQIRAALAQDPINAEMLQDLSSAQESRGNLIEAEAAMRRALEIRPTFAYGHYDLGLLHLRRGDAEAALLEMQQETVDDGKQQGLALVYYALGRKADSDIALAGLLKDPDENALDIAEVYAFRGQLDEAMQWLERAYAQKAPYLYYIKGDQLLKNLKSDSRYKAFLRKMNLPE